MMAELNSFQPRWISPPGATIADILDERAVSYTEFATKMECTLDDVKGLLNGLTPISEETAQRLAKVLGSTTTFWLKREARFRERATVVPATTEVSSSEWVRQFPVADMIKFGWLPTPSNRADRKRALLSYFKVSSVVEWCSAYSKVLQLAAFRTSQKFDSKPGAVAVWLRQGEIAASSINCLPWNPDKFKVALGSIRSLTRNHNPDSFLPQLRDICAECGVAVVILRAPSGCRASGATRFLSPKKALLQLSLRYLSDDHFWFTFFHEAAHLLLHGKGGLFLEGIEMANAKEENEANDFAAQILLPEDFQKALAILPIDYRAVVRFAVRAGVSPGIVVGQMQHKGQLRRNQLNFLKRRFSWH